MSVGVTAAVWWDLASRSGVWLSPSCDQGLESPPESAKFAVSYFHTIPLRVLLGGLRRADLADNPAQLHRSICSPFSSYVVRSSLFSSPAALQAPKILSLSYSLPASHLYNNPRSPQETFQTTHLSFHQSQQILHCHALIHFQEVGGVRVGGEDGELHCACGFPL